MMKMNGHVIGIDAGGTKIKVALCTDGEIIQNLEFPTHARLGGKQCLERIITTIEQLMASHPCSVEAIGLASPGVVDPVDRTTHLTWNIPGWDELNVVQKLEERFSVPVVIENDGNMAAVGEAHYGQHGRSFAFFAVGTGFGAGLVLDNQLWRGKRGAAAEIAKWLMAPDAVNQTFNYGHLEAYMSGSGFETRYEELTGKPLTGRQIFEQMQQGEQVACQVFDEGATFLGMAAANISNFLDLDSIVLGGGVIVGAPEFWLNRVEQIVSKWCIYPPKVRCAVLSDDAVLLGSIVQAYRTIHGGVSV